MVKKIIIIKKNEENSKKNDINHNQSSLNKDRLTDKYIDFIGDLNSKLHSFYWWTSSIGSKNQYVTNIYKNIFLYIDLINRIENSQQNVLKINVSENGVINQLIEYCKKKDINCVIKGKHIKRSFKNIVKPIYLSISPNIKPFYGIKQKLIFEIILGNQIRKKLSKSKEYYVIRSWIDNRSFDKKNNYRDIYFVRFIDYIKNKKDVIILGAILKSFKKQLKKIKKCNSKKDFVIPINFFIKNIDLIKVFFLQFKVFLKIKREIDKLGEIKFEKYNVKEILKDELKQNLIHGEYRKNLISFYIIKNMSKKINCKYFLYTFENHSWEKLAISAFNRYSKKTYKVGYQHSSISKFLLAYFLSKNEKKFIPFPEKIKTVGAETKKIMQKYCNFPEDIVSKGCAFRYEYLSDIKKRPGKIDKNILIACPCDPIDSSKLIKFVSNTFGEKTNYSIKIKCHPATPIDKIIKKGKLKLPKSYKVIKGKGLKDVLGETDILLYNETTVCMEALMLGIPAILIDTDRFYNTNRFFEFNHMNYVVKTTSELKKVFEKIYSMNNSEFREEQKKGKEYINKYFLKVTEERMEDFLKIDKKKEVKKQDERG